MPGKTRKEEALTKIFRWTLIPSVFLLDRVLKIWVLHSLKEGQSIPVWEPIFRLTRVNNTGAAFGLWRGAPFFLLLVTVVSVIVILWFLIRGGRGGPKAAVNFYGWSLVAAGALGNLYDRLHFGYVIDFLDFRVWPVFNAADSAICLGVFWILMNTFWKGSPSSDASRPV